MSELSAKYTLDGQQAIDTLQKTTKEVAKHKRELDALSKQTKQWSRDSNTATGAARTFIDALKKDNVQGMGIAIKGMSSQLLKFTGVGAGAVTALELFNKTINSSQAATDEFGRIQTSVTTVVDNFFSAISTGDFSAFLNGLDNMISKARDAYDAMDDLWNMAQAFDVKNTRLNKKFQENLIEIRKLKGKKDPASKKRRNKLIKENEQIIRTQSSDANTMYKATMDAVRKRIGTDSGVNFANISNEQIFRATEAPINGTGSKLHERYEQYLKELEKLNKQADRKQGRYAVMGRYGVNYANDRNKLEKKYGDAIAHNLLLWKYSDDELKEVNATLKQGIAYENVSISNQRQNLRYAEETNDASGGSSSNKPKPKPDNISYPEGSIAYYEDMISSLHKKIKLQVDEAEIVKLENELKEAIRLKEYLENSSFRARQQGLKDNIQITGLGSLSTPFSEGVNPLNDSLKKIREDIQNNPIEVKIDVQKSIDKLGTLGDAFSDLGSIMSSLGSLTDDAGANIAGIIAQAVATYILGWTEATKQANALGPIGWAAFGLSTAAQVFAMVAQIKSAGAYADGGIIKGGTTIGDYNIARVNAGEMILNKRQQSNLFDIINDGASNNAGTTVSEVRIKGSDLYLALKNYGSTRQTLGKNIGIR